MLHHPRKMTAVVAALGLALAAAACSGSGGKQAEENTEGAAAGKANTPAITSARSPHAQPIRPARGEAGFVSGPSRLKTVGTPISRRTAPACR